MVQPRETLPGQYAIRRVGPLLIGAYARELGEAGYVESIDHVARMIAEVGPAQLGLNMTDFLPDARQRKLAAGNDPRTSMATLRRLAVVSDDPLAFGIFSAIAWMLPSGGPAFRLFAKHEHEAALAWLHETMPFDLDEARRLLADARAQSGV